MSFFGKNFRKTKFENIDELFEANKAPEKIRHLIKNTDSLTRFEKNADGTIQYIVTKDGEVKMNQKMALNAESDFVTPDGITTTLKCQLNGDRLDTVMSFPDGSKLHMERVFENNTLKQTIYKGDVDIKGTIYYEEV